MKGTLKVSVPVIASGDSRGGLDHVLARESRFLFVYGKARRIDYLFRAARPGLSRFPCKGCPRL
jgi:hypothetical protein